MLVKFHNVLYNTDNNIFLTGPYKHSNIYINNYITVDLLYTYLDFTEVFIRMVRVWSTCFMSAVFVLPVVK